MPVVPPQLPSFAAAIRVGRIALLVYALFVPTVMALVNEMPSESTLLLPSPRKLLLLLLVAYQGHALLTAMTPPARTLVRQDVGGVLKTAVVVIIGLPLMHAVHGATNGLLAGRPPVVWLFDRTVPFAEFAPLSPSDVAQAPLEVALATLIDLGVIFLIGGTGYDIVIDGVKRRVTHGWLRSRTPFDAITGLAREDIDVRSASGRRSMRIAHPVILRRTGGPIVLPSDEPSDDRYLDAMAAATGLPRSPG